MAPRCIAAACAGCIASVLTFPLDTRYMNSQLITSRVRPFSGLSFEAISKFAATAVYFQAYESVLETRSPFEASIIGVTTSCMIASPAEVFKRRRQVSGRVRITHTIFLKGYLMSLLRNGPKIVVKFSVYEHLLVLLVRAGMILPFAATISAVLSSLFVTMLFAPVDAVRMTRKRIQYAREMEEMNAKRPRFE